MMNPPVEKDDKITFRTNTELKKRFNALYAGMGIDLTTAFNMFMLQSIKDNKIPFTVTGDTHIPNETTHRALVLSEAKELGLIADDSPRFDSVDTLFEALDGE